jgi:hypothetical protein
MREKTMQKDLTQTQLMNLLTEEQTTRDFQQLCEQVGEFGVSIYYLGGACCILTLDLDICKPGSPMANANIGQEKGETIAEALSKIMGNIHENCINQGCNLVIGVSRPVHEQRRFSIEGNGETPVFRSLDSKTPSAKPSEPAPTG